MTHYEWQDLPDYPEPPDFFYSDQTVHELRRRWENKLIEFWNEHNIKVDYEVLETFGFRKRD